MSLEPSDTNDLCSLEHFAEGTNSQLVYAQDEFGNNIAVGVFVTKSFAENAIEGKDLKEEHDDLGAEGNIDWVAAIEECPMENDSPLQKDLAGDKQDAIRVYKSTKQRKVQKNQLSRKTLKEIREAKSFGTVHTTAAEKKLKERVSYKEISRRPRRKRRSSMDKAYRGPSALMCQHLESNILIFIL